VEVGEMLIDMQLRGCIEEPYSPWSSPIILIWKKNGNLCLCTDYRKLNDVAKKDCFPLPWIDITQDTLVEAKRFFTLDLKSGYWQVNLHPDDKK
jgi:hypothetical protein